MGHTHMWRRGNMLGKGGEASMRHPRIAEFYPSITKPQKHTSSDFTGSVTEREKAEENIQILGGSQEATYSKARQTAPMKTTGRRGSPEARELPRQLLVKAPKTNKWDICLVSK